MRRGLVEEGAVEEAMALGDVGTFVVACPKDTVMYTAAVQAMGVGDRIVVRDVIDLVRPDLAAPATPVPNPAEARVLAG